MNFSFKKQLSKLPTVTAFCSDGARLPRFTITAKVKKRFTMQAWEHIGINISKRMTGFHKIDFSDHHDFDANFQLHSYGEKNIKHLFNDSLLSFFF